MSAALGFGPIRDDDEFLDRLGGRRVESTEGLEGLLASWAASIDEDERDFSDCVGPWGLRPVPDLPEDAYDDETGGVASPEVRVLRVPRSRAVALLGALALTLSGGGVAAAINSTELHPVREAIERAARPALLAVSSGVSPTVAAAPPTDAATQAAALAMVERAQAALDNNEVERARGMIEAIRGLIPIGAGDPQATEITARVDRLEQRLQARPGVAPVSPSAVPPAPRDDVPPVRDTAPVAPQPVAAEPAGTGAPTGRPTVATKPAPSVTSPSATTPVSASPSPELEHAGRPMVPGRTPSEEPERPSRDESPSAGGGATRPSTSEGTASPRPSSGASETAGSVSGSVEGRGVSAESAARPQASSGSGESSGSASRAEAQTQATRSDSQQRTTR